MPDETTVLHHRIRSCPHPVQWRFFFQVIFPVFAHAGPRAYLGRLRGVIQPVEMPVHAGASDSSEGGRMGAANVNAARKSMRMLATTSMIKLMVETMTIMVMILVMMVCWLRCAASFGLLPFTVSCFGLPACGIPWHVLCCVAYERFSFLLCGAHSATKNLNHKAQTAHV